MPTGSAYSIFKGSVDIGKTGTSSVSQTPNNEHITNSLS